MDILLITNKIEKRGKCRRRLTKTFWVYLAYLTSLLLVPITSLAHEELLLHFQLQKREFKKNERISYLPFSDDISTNTFPHNVWKSTDQWNGIMSSHLKRKS